MKLLGSSTQTNGLNISVTGNSFLGSLTHANTATRTYTLPDSDTTLIGLNSALTGYSVGSNTVLAATDTVLSAFGKIQGQINSISSGGVFSFNTRTGAVTLTSSDVTTALNYTPINKAGDTFTGAVLLYTGELSAASSVYNTVTLVGNLGSPWAGKTYFGDGSGWKYAFSRRSASVDTDVLTIQDNGNITSLGSISATTGTFSGTNIDLGSGSSLATRIKIWSGAGNYYLGAESSVAGTLVAGSTAYSLILASPATIPIQFAPSGTVALTLSASGSASFTSSVSMGALTATSGTFSLASQFGGSAHADATVHIQSAQGGFGRVLQMSPLAGTVSADAVVLIAGNDASGTCKWWTFGVNANGTNFRINPGVGFSGGGIWVDTSSNLSISGALTAKSAYNTTISNSITPIAKFNNGGAVSLWVAGNGYNNMWIQAIQDDGTNNPKDILFQPLGGNAIFSSSVSMGALSATQINGKSNLSNQQAPLNYVYIGSTDDNVTDTVVLLHPAYNGTAITKYLFDGIISFQRGSTGASNISDNYEVKTSTAYTSNTGSIISRNTSNTANLITCIYNSVLYTAIYVLKMAGRDIYYKGDLLSTLTSPLVLSASSVSNVSVLAQDNTNIGGALAATTGTFSTSISAPNAVTGGASNAQWGKCTTNLSNFNQGLPSGFYDGSNATGNIPGTNWNHLINSAHFNSYSGNQYQLQIAADFWDQEIYFRKIYPSALTPAWTRYITSANLGNTGLAIGGTTGTFSGALTATSGTINGPVEIGTGADKTSINAGSIGFNRRTYDGAIYDNTGYAYQWQHTKSTTAASDYLSLGVWNPSGTLIAPTAIKVDGNGNTYLSGSLSATQFNGSGAGLTGTASSLTAGNATTTYTAGANTNTIYLTGFSTSSNGYNNYLYTNSPVYMNAGTVYATNFGATSDERLKTNITPILNPINKVKNLNGFYFNWNELAPSSDKTTTHVGVSAQHTLKTFPEAVVEGEEYLSVTYDSFIPLLIECVKEQQKEIEELKRLIHDFTK
jgi:hypothetical protein